MSTKDQMLRIYICFSSDCCLKWHIEKYLCIELLFMSCCLLFTGAYGVSKKEIQNCFAVSRRKSR